MKATVPPEAPAAARRTGPSPSSDERQRLAEQAVMALAAILRHARNYSADNPVFTPWLQQLQESMRRLLAADGAFSLQSSAGGLMINDVLARTDGAIRHVLEALEQELGRRGLSGLTATAEPPPEELRALLRQITRSGGTAEGGAPLRSLRLVQREPSSTGEPRPPPGAERTEKLLDTYARAAVFVDRTIEQLRAAGAAIRIRAASRVVQDLVDLQGELPTQFIQLASCKPVGDYFGQHAANVAVLAIGFAAALGIGRERRHDLGMAALLHDVGIAALPSTLLTKVEPLSERELLQLKSSPLFAARAILRDGQVHAAALERAMASYESHLDLVPPPGEPLHDIGLPGRILALCEAFDALTTERPFRPARSPRKALRVMQTDLMFRFDPLLLDLLPRVLEPLLG